MSKQIYFIVITPIDDTNKVLNELETGVNILADAKTWMDENLESQSVNLQDGEYLAILRCRQGDNVEKENHYIKNIKIVDGEISII